MIAAGGRSENIQEKQLCRHKDSEKRRAGNALGAGADLAALGADHGEVAVPL